MSRGIDDLTQVHVDRFWSRVKVDQSPNPNVCWEWDGPTDPYGKLWIKTDNIGAHRISYFLHYDQDPEELSVLHKCDNPKCVNPAHLFLGTMQDNTQDMVTKDRHYKKNFTDFWDKNKDKRPKWEENPAAELTNEQVIEIKKKWNLGGVTQRELATQYDTTQVTISFIINEKQWIGIGEAITRKDDSRYKITLDDIAVIKRLKEQGKSCVEISKIYGVHSSAISRIISGKRQKQRQN